MVRLDPEECDLDGIAEKIHRVAQDQAELEHEHEECVVEVGDLLLLGELQLAAVRLERAQDSKSEHVLVELDDALVVDFLGQILNDLQLLINLELFLLGTDLAGAKLLILFDVFHDATVLLLLVVVG